MLLAIDIGNTQTVIGLFNSPADRFDPGHPSPEQGSGDSAAEADLVDHWLIATNAEP